MTRGSENRRGGDLRVKASFRVRFRSMDDLVLAYTRNLSRGGMRLRTTADFPPGSTVEVRIDLPDGGPEVRVPCEVVDRHREEGTEAYNLGVRFLDPTETTRRRLEWYILNSEPEAGQFGKDSPFGYHLKILVVDDEPRQREATARPFVERGDLVSLAADGLDALAQALSERPDVIVTDVQMPRMDGWQLLRMLRSRPQLANVPVLFLTTLDSEAHRLKGYRMGVDDYIAKPPKPEDLTVRVDRAAVRSLQFGVGAEAPPEQGLRGDLEQVGLASVLAFLEMERMSGVLRVGPEVNGRVLLQDGRPVQAFIDVPNPDSKARARLFRLLDIRRGRFEFAPQDVDATDEIRGTTSSLLLEHARLRDEAAR